jgi:hypothetical protein
MSPFKATHECLGAKLYDGMSNFEKEIKIIKLNQYIQF